MSEMGTLFLSSSSQHPMGELGAREAPTTADWPVPVRPTIPRTCACLAEHPDGQCPMACACLAEHPDGQCPMACACLADHPDGQCPMDCACLAEQPDGQCPMADHPDGLCLSGRASRWPVPDGLCLSGRATRWPVPDGLCLSGRATRWPVPVWPTIPMACACLAEHPEGQCPMQAPVWPSNPMAFGCLAEQPDGLYLSGRPSRWPLPVWASIPMGSARWPLPVWASIPTATHLHDTGIYLRKNRKPTRGGIARRFRRSKEYANFPGKMLI